MIILKNRYSLSNNTYSQLFFSITAIFILLFINFNDIEILIRKTFIILQILEKVWLSTPHIGENEKRYIHDAFQSNWVTSLGQNVEIFEKQLSDYIGADGTVALNSGTAGLHLALIALGVQKDDVVLCQSFTFAASAFPILYLQANPVFIDSEYETWNMDPELLEKSIEDHLTKGKKPAAIIMVHLYGMPAKMNEIMSIAAKFDIPIIEDAAEALGSKYNNVPCGSFGKVGILSFNGNKIITTSAGGAIVSDDKNIIKKVRHWSAQSKEPVNYYLHFEIGYNYRMSNICAGIGRGQMEVLEDRVLKRRKNFEIYKEGLAHIRGISFLQEPAMSFSNRWLTTLLFDEKEIGIEINEKVRVALDKNNIESRLLWKPLHQQPVFSSYQSYVNGVSDRLFNTGLCLPSGSNMNEEQLERVIQIVKQSLK